MGSRNLRVAAVAAVSVAALAAPALAAHGWNTYHWAKGSGPLALDVGDNVSAKWDNFLTWSMDGGPRLAELGGPATGWTGEGWNDTDQIKSTVVAGSTSPKNCKAVAGTIQVCSERYGRNGWLGLAQIWLSGGHIAQATTKVNDTYFDTPSYNKHEWRIMVMCQEIGHDYGLGHVNESNTNPNTGSCMDYTNAPARDDGKGTNEYINAHDKEQLGVQYGHLDSLATNFAVREVGKAVPQNGFSDDGIGGNTPASWGRAVGYDGAGRPNVYVLDMGGGRKKVTHVFWTLEARRGEHHD